MTALPPSTALANTPFAYDLRKAIHKNRLVGILKMMQGFHLRYLVAITSQGMSSLGRTMTMLLLRYFIDTVLGAKQYNMLIWTSLGFIGLAAAEGLFTTIAARNTARTSEGMALRLRNYLYDHIQRLTFTYHDQTKTGELIQRSTSDVDAVRSFFADQAIGVGRILLLFIINFTAVWNLHWKLALVSIIIMPLVIATSAFFFKKASKVYEAYQEQEATLSTTLQENLTGVRVVKAFARQEYEIQKFEKDNQEKYQRGKRLARMHSFFWPVTDLICGGQMVGGLVIAALMVINNEITIGTYMAFAGLVMFLIWPMRNMGRLIVQTSTGLVSFNRVMEVVRQNEEPLFEGDYFPAAGVRGEFLFKDVCFAYEDAPDTPVLKNINFTCKPGDAVALLGSTGSGKTTLVNLLPRFYNYTAGNLTLDGVELKHYPRQYLRQQIGIVEQEPFLFSRTIRENITRCGS